MNYEVFDCYAYGTRKKMYTTEAKAKAFVRESSDPEACAHGRSVPEEMLTTTEGLKPVPVVNRDFCGDPAGGGSGTVFTKSNVGRITVARPTPDV